MPDFVSVLIDYKLVYLVAVLTNVTNITIGYRKLPLIGNGLDAAY